MAISLQKGQKVDLTKDNPGLTKLLIGLGWDTKKYDGGADFDLDSSAFLLNQAGKAGSEKDFVFYGSLKHQSGAVVHQGDNRTGIGDGDDEQVKVDLSLVPQDIHRIAFTVTIYEAESRRQNFGQVSNAYIRVFDEAKQTELLRFDLGEDFSVETALVVAELYRSGAEWRFNAIGMGYQGGLKALATSFGISVA
ncbi:MAG: TerD family protein [Spirochaetaceae bacterium]|jgi:tellurium resistance protein TerD|nr:TerD family protein [Spirochaetaceae bacterium]